MTGREVAVWMSGRGPVRNMSRRAAVVLFSITYLAMAWLTYDAHGRESAAQHRADTAVAKRTQLLDAFDNECVTKQDGSVACPAGSVIVVEARSHAR